MGNEGEMIRPRISFLRVFHIHQPYSVSSISHVEPFGIFYLNSRWVADNVFFHIALVSARCADEHCCDENKNLFHYSFSIMISSLLFDRRGVHTLRQCRARTLTNDSCWSWGMSVQSSLARVME